jgi:hypothetical protein
MRAPLQLLEIAGKDIPLSDLKIPRAKQFAEYLLQAGTEVFATPVGTLLVSDDVEAVLFRVQVQRPQYLAYDIRREETLAAIFTGRDHTYPQVFALRKDFPAVPHLNLLRDELPRSLCLYDQPWQNVRLNWTPAQFLSRTRYWLAQTALGTLHAEDQPLEPLIQGSSSRIILPSDFSVWPADQNGRALDIFRAQDQPPGEVTLIAHWHDAQQNHGAIHSTPIIIQCPTQTHGVIRREPNNLQELHEICAESGMNLAKDVAAKIKVWHLAKPDQRIFDTKLMLILVLPKAIHSGTKA